MVKFVVLNQKAFRSEYQKAFKGPSLKSESTKEKFRQAVFDLQGRIVKALKRKWTEMDDFEVGWDFDYCRHACGGIYSERAFCSEYVETIASVLKDVEPKGKWTYHTSCEILVNPEAKTMGEAVDSRGEFFIRGSSCYVNGATISRAHRERLGCFE